MANGLDNVAPSMDESYIPQADVNVTAEDEKDEDNDEVVTRNFESLGEEVY